MLTDPNVQTSVTISPPSSGCQLRIFAVGGGGNTERGYGGAGSWEWLHNLPQHDSGYHHSFDDHSWRRERPFHCQHQ